MANLNRGKRLAAMARETAAGDSVTVSLTKVNKVMINTHSTYICRIDEL